MRIGDHSQAAVVDQKRDPYHGTNGKGVVHALWGHHIATTPLGVPASLQVRVDAVCDGTRRQGCRRSQEV
ncbi:MAG: hypothetical protein HYR55_03020 [Acidobacteria bacterium]|nr:hypothetical protein [Acidobacteriota bacterium]MBI3657010.1 hypothetical protein [Acidobacteriota bacterium]